MIKTAASAQAPSTSPATVHRRAERPRRDAIIAIKGASARSITIEVAIRLAGGSRYPIRANPDAMLRRLAIMVIGLRDSAPYI
jgi:hypothetical protein